MENKITESFLRKTANAENLSKGADLGKVKKRTEGERSGMEISLKRNYNAISKNGDTLELSEAGRTLGVHTEAENMSPSDKSSMEGSGKKIADVALAGYSKTQLKQLYVSKKITKQHYERILKKQK